MLRDEGCRGHAAGGHPQATRFDLYRHASRTQGVGEAHQILRLTVAGAGHQHQYRFVRSCHAHQAAIFCDQHIADLHGAAGGQADVQFAPGAVGSVKMGLLALGMRQGQLGRALEQGRGDLVLIVQELVDVQHRHGAG